GGLMGRLARLHVHTIVPAVGGAISGAAEYRYLQGSIAAFPPPDEFAAMMGAAGIEVLAALPLTFGAACLFVGAPRGA
ncbi:MAG: class I SAM-dependent methyltransferase, partial [Polyangiaceae bacterium]|nr:class I SAM-dependent methyltransferase [Polyangiaceae bacterium]